MLADRSGRLPTSGSLAVRLEWLTLERAGYVLAAIMALGLRLWAAGRVPLGPMEAVQALPALAAAQGGSPDLAGVSPLLHLVQRAIFSLFGPGDGAARFFAALVGGLSPLLFYFVRGRLSRGGALAAAFLWAVSPLAVWSSRVAVGDALVPAAALACWAAFSSKRTQGWAFRVSLCLGLLLLTGPNAFTAVLAGAAALLVLRPDLRSFSRDLPHARRGALAGLGITLVVATVAGAEPAGLAAAADLPGRWLAGMWPGAGEYTAGEMLARLLLNELFLVALGVAGAIRMFRTLRRRGRAIALAVAVALAVALLGRGRDPLDLSLVALGLALLAGPVVVRVLELAYTWRRSRDPWFLFLASGALLFTAFTAIPSGLSPANPGEWRSLYLVVGVVAAIMAAVSWVAYGTWDGWQTVRETLPLLLLVFGLAWSASQMVSLSHDNSAWRQPAILHEVAASDLADLRHALTDLGGLTGGARDAKIDVAWPDLASDPRLPVLRWQLRDFQQLRVAASIAPDPARLVITPPEDQPRLAGYRGAGFAVLQRWTPAQLPDRQALLRWLLYREARSPVQKSGLVLWINTDSQR